MRLSRHLVPALVGVMAWVVPLGAQEPTGTITGRVLDATTLQPLSGVNVQIRGTQRTALTAADGAFVLSGVPAGIHQVRASRIGYAPLQQGVNVAAGAEATLQFALPPQAALLDEVIVTGYTQQRRAEVTGAVSSANLESVSRQTSASALQRLDGRVPGVTVEASGSPGSRNTVRIRGISSFQNNDPLYVVDGTPVSESFMNWLNPNDIGSIQVLKDAAAASIYGARANNGVVVIETKRGRTGLRRVSLDIRTGVASPVRGYDDFLIQDALEYFEIVKRSTLGAGFPIDSVPRNVYGNPNDPSIPTYIWPNDGKNRTNPDTIDPASYSFPSRLIIPGSPGTNWWDAVFSPAPFTEANLAVSGGGADNAYYASFSYFNQEGTAAYNRFQRGTIRLNTEFDLGRVTIGENLSLSLDEHFGGMPDDPGGFAEGGILGKNILMQPVVPVYDIRGNFASGKAVGLGNQSNPLKEAWGNKDDITRNTRMFGNAFANFELRDRFSFRTRFGFNLAEGSFRGYAPIFPENSEPTLVDAVNENSSRSTDWTWDNTLTYAGTFDRHNVAVLIGHAASATRSRFIAGSINQLLNTDIDSRYIQDALANPATKNVNSSGGTGALLSFFGKLDYNFAEKYHLSFTLRRDGSSRLGPSHRWGTFPAIGAGWRLSREPFLAENDFFTNIMLRFGWGITGNQSIPTGRNVNQFGGGRGDTFYDIGGTNSTIAQGFRQTSLGNPDLKWEENKTVNVGVDLEFLQGSGNLTLDLYQREADDLLFDPRLPATAGVAAPPIVNIGKMRNRGVDLSIGYRGTIGDGTSWSVNLNGSRYKNEIVRIDGVQTFFFGPVTTRFGNQVINQVGHPIGAFYGLVADGFFANQAEVNAHAIQGSGAKPGQIRFRDLNGDGRITLADRTIIGDPHPDFTAGLDLGLRWGAWDFNATLFGTFGNEIFDVQKEFYVFRNFSTNVRRDLLTDSWTDANGDGQVDNPNAKYPKLDVNDAFSRQISSYYIEDGSYIRLRNVQVGYTVPTTWAWLPGMRLFVQGENLFTATQYPGLDPALPAANVTRVGGQLDIRDQYRGVDRGSYPSNRTFTFGVSATF